MVFFNEHTSKPRAYMASFQKNNAAVSVYNYLTCDRNRQSALFFLKIILLIFGVEVGLEWYLFIMLTFFFFFKENFG